MTLQERLEQREKQRQENSKLFNEIGINKLVGIGWYYKQDTDNGFGYHVMQFEKDTWKFTQELHKNCDKAYKKVMYEIENKIGEFKNITLSDFQLDIINQTNSFISEFWKEMGFKDGKQPLKKRIFIDLSKENIGMLVTLICMNIYFISQWGLIPDDEYNGMCYNYSNLNF